MIQIIDNVIPLSYQEHIKSTLLGRDFSWYFAPDVSMKGNAQQRPGASHVFIRDGIVNSNHASLFAPLAMIASSGFGKFVSINSARTFLQYPLNPEIIGDKLDMFHVDSYQPHLVVLYYVMDSDGDTILIDKKFNGTPEYDIQDKEFNIIQKVTPKQGRAVIFDGSIYHTAEQPKYNMRCVVNYNIIMSEV